MRASLSDRDLIRAYREGDERAFETLLNRYQSGVFSKIVFVVRDHEVANDLFQDTWIKVVKVLKSGKYVEEGKFGPWVMRIAHNAAIDHFRRNRKKRMVRPTDEFDIFDTLAHDAPNAMDTMVQEEVLAELRQLIPALPEEQRAVVKMRLEQQYSFKEIAEETGVSINTALGRMRYALINLRRMVDEQQLVLTTG
ncbi:MAG TPA: RNA polymerase subunit sigma-24 [Flavobacteriales bacterium]|nr:RNA polymerase subunit sigma-24 [Crocinitomicaceae bacterium]MDC3397451.1 sigma-70 family RNA polymerase sigma factor [Flavobacteriales bacterium]HCC64425.1 RNA polymerase subunit sigma-24 [Flavobacteriales bacterium]|tara:strand:+ start:569 stop:1153 length:585 start_codon:yes stop_codon:yes gene_type:complete